MKKLILGSLSLAVLVSNNAFADLDNHHRVVYKDMPVFATTWTGLYGGINLGWGWGNKSITFSSPDVSGAGAIAAGVIPSSLAGHPNGIVAGVQAGYNYQYNSAVFGIEADFQGTEIEDHETVNTAVPGFFQFSTYSKQNIEALGTLRARLGWAPVDPLLLYVTGGGAYGRTKLNGNITNPGCVGFCASNSTVNDKGGWVAGAGIEYLVDCNLSAKAEYLYYDLGHASQTLSNPLFATSQRQSVDFKGNIFRFGLNYKFM